MSDSPKTCPGARFKYFSHCERCDYSEAIADLGEPWPRCEVCGDAKAVYAIGSMRPLRAPDAADDPAGAEFIERRNERFNGEHHDKA